MYILYMIVRACTMYMYEYGLGGGGASKSYLAGPTQMGLLRACHASTVIYTTLKRADNAISEKEKKRKEKIEKIGIQTSTSNQTPN